MNNTNNALETLVQRDKQIKKANDKLKASINKLDAELETTTNALLTHASNTDIHTSKEELIQLIVDHLESLDLGITKEVVSVLPTENISDNTLYFVPNSKGSSDEYFYINDKWELIGSTETNFTDYYTKLETDTLLEGKANSVHNHVVSDITDFPTIPTKTSQLINDSGFLTSSNGLITSVSWNDITSKPSFSDIAISGSYNDLVDTPTIPTKTSELTNDSDFAIDNDVVHKTGNETINGVKTFTVAPYASNSATTNGYYIKLNALARNEVPTQLYHATFRALDKNNKILGEYCVEKSTSGSSLLHMDVHTEDSEGNDIMESLYLNLSNDGSTVSFHPAKNNRTDLGMAHCKWADVYSTNTVTNKVITYSVTNHDNTSSMTISGGSSRDKGSTLFLYGDSHSSHSGAFNLTAKNTTNTSQLIGFPNGTLTWGGKNVALDENLVHRSGEEHIKGVKHFYNAIYGYQGVNFLNDAMDINTTPASTLYSNIHFKDKNYKTISYIQYSHNPNGINNLGFFITDSANKLYGVVVNSAKEFYPFGDNTYSLGKSNMRWRNAHITYTYTNRVTTYSIAHPTDDSYFFVCGGSDYDKGATLYLGGVSATNFTPGRFALAARKTDGSSVELAGSPDGSLTWGGKSLAIDENLVHKTGNETIAGTKTFSNTIISNSVLCTNGNAFMAQNGGYTFLIRNDGSNTYFLMSDKDGTPGTWSTARPLIINNATGVCSINGNANSATYATTQATSDNSTKIATTAWVSTYVNSRAGFRAVGPSTVGSSISAYYSNATTLTAEGNSSSSGGSYPSDYSDYINIAPTVGTIYTGSQLFGTLNASASGSTNSYSPSGSTVYQTTAKATANFSGAFSASAKYLCTTANAVKFRAFVSEGTTSNIGTASIVDNSSTKSIFTRIE